MNNENDKSFYHLHKCNEDVSEQNENSRSFSNLKRLKIQEQLILNHRVLTSVLKEFVDIGDGIRNWKTFSNNLMKKYFEIKNLFDDIRLHIGSEEKLQSTDIEDIRKDVLNLESFIMSYKKHLQTELNILEETQGELYNKIFSKEKTRQEATKLKIKPYNHIVPSPVKAIINSPYKNEEVQQHQDFLRKYGPYGGWNEVYHNMFLKTYKKYSSDVNSDYKHNIVDELIQKLPGFTSDDIIKHIDWFNTFQTLKNNQQKALSKWRDSKNILKSQHSAKYRENNKENTAEKLKGKEKEDRKQKGTSNDKQVYRSRNNKLSKTRYKDETVIVHYIEDIDNMTDRPSEKRSENFLKMNKSMYMQSTEQWTNRCKNYSECQNVNDHLSINNMPKLSLPCRRRRRGLDFDFPGSPGKTRVPN